ncbi:putative ribonuclease H-like domain-containing protein [Tanacetum coccineum]
MNHKKPQTILSVLENVSILLMMFSLKHLSDDEEHYHEDASDNGLIRNGNSKKRISTGKDGVVRVLPPVSAAEIHAVEKERKARRNHLISGIPGTSEKISWNGTMQKKFGIFEAFTISSSEGLEKGYGRFQQLLSQLEAHGAEVSTKDANHKVFEQELTSTSKSSASATKCSLLFHTVKEVTAGFADEVIYSLFAKQSEDLDLLHEDLEQIDDVDVEEMDINWQIAMIAIKMKKFYKKTGRRVRIDGNKPVGARKKEQNQNYLLTMDDGVVNWGEHTVEKEETNQALMEISSNNELTFQANEIYAKDEKFKRYRRIGMKAVKEKEQLKKTVDSWKDSSKNLWKLIDSGMSSTSKVGLGYEIKSNNEVLSYEEEMNRSVFKCTAEDYINKPLYSRFTKTNSFKGVPHPLTGDYTPKPQEEIDDSLYVYGKKGPQKPEVSDSDDNSTEHSTCQSNDSEGSCGNTSEHSSESEVESISVPNEMSTSKSVITNEKVVSESKEVEPSCAKHVKTPRQQMKNQGTSEVKGKNWNKMMERELGEGYSFIKKKCFVCGSLSHLIKDCDYYEKKMAREAEFKKQRVFNTGNRVAKPVWTNANRVNHANQFVPRPVQLNAGRPNINSVRPNINTGRTNVNSVRPKVNTVSSNVNTVRSRQPVPTRTSNSFSPKRPQVNQFNQRRHFSKSYSPVRRPIDRNTAKMSYFNAVKGNWGTAVKTSAGYNWRNSRPNSNCDSGQIFIRTVNAKGSSTQEHGGQSFDMKTPTPAKGFACLIAKATSDESKLWHRRFSWVFFLASKDETSGILQNFIRQIENQLSHRCAWQFDGKSDEGFLVGYSLNSKAYRVYNLVTKRVEVNLHVNFLEDKPNVKGVGYRWMFDIDYLTDSMNYIPVSLENQANPHAGTSEVTNSAGTSQTPIFHASEEKDEEVELIVVPSAVKNTEEKVKSRTSSKNSKNEEILTEPQQEKKGQVSENTTTSTPSVNTGNESVNTGRLDPDDSPMPELEIFHKSETGIFDEASYDEEGVITDFNSLPTEIEVSPTPTLRIHNIHPKSQILGDPKSAVQTRSKVQQKSGAHALFSFIQKQQRNNHKDQQHCLFACFLSQEEPKKIAEALQDDSWVQAMQEELLQFKLQQVWVLVDLPQGMKVIGTIQNHNLGSPFIH